MKRILASILCILILTQTAVAQESLFGESDRRDQDIDLATLQQTVLTDVYTDAEYMGLIDVEEATKTLAEVSASLELTEEERILAEEQNREVTASLTKTMSRLERARANIADTQKSIQRTLQKIALYEANLRSTKVDLLELSADIEESRNNVALYTKFLYTTYNELYGSGSEIDIVRLLLNSDSIADGVSMGEMGAMLTEALQNLLVTIRDQQHTQAKKYLQYTKTRDNYMDASIMLEVDLKSFEEQQRSLSVLVKSLESIKDRSAVAIDELTEQEASLGSYISTLQTITSGSASSVPQAGTRAAIVAGLKDRDEGPSYMKWPFTAAPYILQTFGEQSDEEGNTSMPAQSLVVELEQGSPLYATAPGVVHTVIRPAGATKARVLLIHKYGYSTIYTPLNTVAVEEGQVLKRGEFIGTSGGRIGTFGAGINYDDDRGEHLEFAVLKNGTPIDPLSVLDVSIYLNVDDLPEQRRPKHEQMMELRTIKLERPQLMYGDTLIARMREFLSLYATPPWNNAYLWTEASRQTGINPVFGMCIGFAETSFKNFKTENNIGNVGNNDRGDTRTFPTPIAGARALFNVFNNQYLGSYETLNEFSRFGNENGFIYASSPFNRQNNIMKCLTSVYGYRVTEDFPVRIQ